MAEVARLALTDDEAAVIAAQAGGAWRAPLPTVDETDEGQLTAAILRGRRSLVVRALADQDGTAKGEAAQVLARLGPGPWAAFMLLDSAGKWVPSGPTIYLYGTGPDEVSMSHVAVAAGVHYFRVSPPPQQWLALTELAKAVFDDGFADAGEEAGQRPATALLWASGGSGPRGVRVGHKQASAVDGPEPVTFASVDEAVNWLLS